MVFNNNSNAVDIIKFIVLAKSLYVLGILLALFLTLVKNLDVLNFGNLDGVRSQLLRIIYFLLSVDIT